MDFPILNGVFLIVSLSTMLLWSTRSAWARRANIPDVAAFLLVGILVHIAFRTAGVHISGSIRPLNSPLAMTMAASFVIFWGAAELSPQTLRTVAKPIAALATIGVVVSGAILGLTVWGAHLAHLPLFAALLLGAILAGTDPTVLVSIVDQVPIADRIREVLIAESALNDPISAILAVAFLPFATGHAGASHIWPAVTAQLWEAAAAVAAGLTAVVFVQSVRRASLPLSRAVMRRTDLRFVLLFLVAFALAEGASANPFLAGFVAGVAGQPFAHGDSTSSDAAEHRSAAALHVLSFYVRAYIFLLLGLTIPTSLQGRSLLPALLTAGLLIVAARPLSVLAARLVYRNRLTRHETIFLCLNRQTGVMPALLINIFAASGLAEADFFRLTAACAIALTSGVLLPFFRPLAGRLGLLVPVPPEDDADPCCDG